MTSIREALLTFGGRRMRALAATLWLFGSLAVMIDAPSCGGSLNDLTSRAVVAVVWPLLVSANAARSTFGYERRILACSGGVLSSARN